MSGIQRGALAAIVIVSVLGSSCVASPGGNGETRGSVGARAPEVDALRQEMRRAEVRLPRGAIIVAEIAETPERLRRGYMFRPEVPDGEGMILVFPEEEFHHIWMKNCLVALDIIWLDEEFRVVDIEASAPPCESDPCPSYGALRKSTYVLEVRAGTAARERLEVGDRLEVIFPGGRGGGGPSES